MKTEKRLTMALSVLVALMMLAVPFASIVDTSNENGENSLDAPVLGDIGDLGTLAIDLNIPEDSADVINYKTLVSTLNSTSTLNTIEDTADQTYKYTLVFSYDSASNSLVIEFTDNISTGSAEIDAFAVLEQIKTTIDDSRVGYTLEWDADKTVLESTMISDESAPAFVGIEWTIADGFAEANVTLTMTDYLENETTLTYTKAVKTSEVRDTEQNLTGYTWNISNINDDLLPAELKGLGKEIVLGAYDLEYVYARTISVANASTTLGTTSVLASESLEEPDEINGVDVENNNVANNIFTLTYEPLTVGQGDADYPYSYIPLIITSEIFDEDVIIYVSTTSPNQAIVGYVNLIDALLVGEYLKDIINSNKVGYIPEHLNESGEVVDTNLNAEEDGFDPTKTPITSNDGSYKLIKWAYNNGVKVTEYGLFDTVANISLVDRTSITVELIAEEVSYPVLFIIGSEYQLVYVSYGNLSEDSCTLNKEGVTSWVRYNYATGEITNRSVDINAATYENVLKTSSLDKTKLLTFIGLKSFTPTNTMLVKFHAAGYDGVNALKSSDGETPGAYFEIFKNGDEELIIDHIPVAVAKGTTANNIPLPLADPLVLIGEEDAASKFKFMYWNASKMYVASGSAGELPSKPTNEPYAEYTFPSTDPVNIYWNLNAVYCLYNFEIELYVNNSLYATIYCENEFTTTEEGSSPVSLDSIVMVEFADGDVTFNVGSGYYPGETDFEKSLAKALIPVAPAGYSYEYWADSEGNEVFKAGTIPVPDAPAGAMMILLNFAEDFDNVCNEEDHGHYVGQKCINEDTALYAYFEAKSFVVFYISNYGGASFSTLYQIGTVDDELVLFGNQAFPNAALSLKSWVTQLNGQGDEYDLLANVTIDGETYESLILDNALDLKTVYGLDGAVLDTVLKALGIVDLNTGDIDYTEIASLADLDLSALILYANWEDVAAGEPGTSEPGTSSENNNETSIETYLLAVILILIILALIIIVVMMRNKQ